ncbi:MAG: N-acetylmuramoyl-L-alanine amidase [Pseudomonadota bacterium]
MPTTPKAPTPKTPSIKPRDPRAFQFDLPPDRRPAPIALNEQWLPQAIEVGADGAAPWRAVTRPRPIGPKADPLEAVEAMVVHATAGSSTLGAFSVMLDGRASYHWLIPDEDEAAHGDHVWATAPERRAAWHVRNSCTHPNVCGGRGRLNDVSLGLEIVNAQTASSRRDQPDRFSDWQIEASAEITRYAWAKYPRLRHVVSHARLDPDRRTDPGAHFPWERFQRLVLGEDDVKTSNDHAANRCHPPTNRKCY